MLIPLYLFSSPEINIYIFFCLFVISNMTNVNQNQSYSLYWQNNAMWTLTLNYNIILPIRSDIPAVLIDLFGSSLNNAWRCRATCRSMCYSSIQMTTFKPVKRISSRRMHFKPLLYTKESTQTNFRQNTPKCSIESCVGHSEDKLRSMEIKLWKQWVENILHFPEITTLFLEYTISFFFCPSREKKKNVPQVKLWKLAKHCVPHASSFSPSAAAYRNGVIYNSTPSVRSTCCV